MSTAYDTSMRSAFVIWCPYPMVAALVVVGWALLLCFSWSIVLRFQFFKAAAAAFPSLLRHVCRCPWRNQLSIVSNCAYKAFCISLTQKSPVSRQLTYILDCCPCLQCSCFAFLGPCCISTPPCCESIWWSCVLVPSPSTTSVFELSKTTTRPELLAI